MILSRRWVKFLPYAQVHEPHSFIPLFLKWTLPALNMVRTIVPNGPAAEKRDLRNICEQRRSRPACASAQSGQDLRNMPTQYRNLVEDIGLIVKALRKGTFTHMRTANILTSLRIRAALRKHDYSNIFKISPPKTESFQIKILIFFSYCCSKHRLWVLVWTASPRRSNEYPQSMLLSRNREKIVYTPVNPSFTI